MNERSGGKGMMQVSPRSISRVSPPPSYPSYYTQYWPNHVVTAAAVPFPVVVDGVRRGKGVAEGVAEEGFGGSGAIAGQWDGGGYHRTKFGGQMNGAQTHDSAAWERAKPGGKMEGMQKPDPAAWGRVRFGGKMKGAQKHASAAWEEFTGANAMEENDDYKELGPEYRMTPLPSRTGQGSSTLLEEDAPLGEGRDEFGNDVSAKRNQEIFRAAREAHIKALKAEASAIRQGEHPEVIRKRRVIEEARKRRQREREIDQARRAKSADTILRLQKDSIKAGYTAAVEKVRRDLLNGVEKKLIKMETKMKKCGILARKPKRRLTRATKSADDVQGGLKSNHFDIDHLTAAACLRKYNSNADALVEVDLKLGEDPISQDIAMLRELNKEASSEYSANNGEDEKEEEEEEEEENDEEDDSHDQTYRRPLDRTRSRSPYAETENEGEETDDDGRHAQTYQERRDRKRSCSPYAGTEREEEEEEEEEEEQENEDYDSHGQSYQGLVDRKRSRSPYIKTDDLYEPWLYSEVTTTTSSPYRGAPSASRTPRMGAGPPGSARTAGAAEKVAPWSVRPINGSDDDGDGSTGATSPPARPTGGNRAAKRACYGFLTNTCRVSDGEGGYGGGGCSEGGGMKRSTGVCVGGTGIGVGGIGIGIGIDGGGGGGGEAAAVRSPGASENRRVSDDVFGDGSHHGYGQDFGGVCKAGGGGWHGGGSVGSRGDDGGHGDWGRRGAGEPAKWRRTYL